MTCRHFSQNSRGSGSKLESHKALLQRYNKFGKTEKSTKTYQLFSLWIIVWIKAISINRALPTRRPFVKVKTTDENNPSTWVWWPNAEKLACEFEMQVIGDKRKS